MSDDAASSVFAVMLAAVVVLGAFGYVLFQTRGAVDNKEPDTAVSNNQAEARMLAQTLLGSPGFALGTGEDWTATPGGPDNLARLGLRSSGLSHAALLDYAKFDNLRLAPEADASKAQGGPGDGYVNYPEAKESLGLEGMDFHIRAYPNLKKVEEVLENGFRDPNLRIAYVGDWLGATESGGGPPPGLAVRDLACGPSPLDSGVMRLTATIENGGLGPTMFNGVFDAIIDGRSERREGVTFVVPAGQTATLRADFVGDTGWRCQDVSAVDVEVYDPSLVKIAEFTFGAPTITSPVTAEAADILVRGGNANLYVLDSEAAVLDFEGPRNNDILSARVYDLADPAAPLLVWSLLDFKPKDEGYAIEIPANALGPGSYEMRYSFAGSTVGHRVVVVGSPVATYQPPGGMPGAAGWHASADEEARFISNLIERFCPYQYDSTTETPMTGAPAWTARCPFKPDAATGQPGDVYQDVRRDLQQGLSRRLVHQGGPMNGQPNLDSTNVLVVGSGVDHQPMVHIKSEVAAWVAAGGTLIVFGSEDTNTQWMQSLFHLGIQSSSNGITVNDASHPILHVPDDLAYDDYDNRGQSWKFTGTSQDLFTQIVNEEDQDSTILSVSDAGVFGKGSVLVTAWFPYDLFGTGTGGPSDVEGHRFVNNLLMLSYRTLYLDYGPPIPAGASVIGETSKASIVHPQLGNVSLDVVVYLFDA